MPKYLMSLLMLFFCLLASATSFKALGDSAYMRGDYVTAITHYGKALTQGHNPYVYNNLGNAYYRLEQYPQAILAYERGLRYAPSDQALAHSLVLANSKLPERLRSTPPFFISTWYHQALLWLSISGWMAVAVVSLGLALALWLVYRLAPRSGWRKVGFFGSLCLLLACFWASWATFALRHYLDTHTSAIVMQRTPAADSPSTHSTATSYVPLGTKVDITDRSLKDFWRITLPDGKSVWVKRTHLEVI